MNTAVIYSSLTGNTEKIALAIHSVLPQGSGLFRTEEMPDTTAYDIIALGYWADKGTADTLARRMIDSLQGKKLVLFGTLGAYTHSRHALDCQIRVWDLAAAKNEVLGSYICQGKVSSALADKFKKLPADHPHAMNESRLRRHAEAAKHPDALDEENAREFMRKILYQHG